MSIPLDGETPSATSPVGYIMSTSSEPISIDVGEAAVDRSARGPKSAMTSHPLLVPRPSLRRIQLPDRPALAPHNPVVPARTRDLGDYFPHTF
jgi:hypothetical protein